MSPGTVTNVRTSWDERSSRSWERRAFALSGHECQAGSFHGATEALFAIRGTANLLVRH